MEQKLKEDFIFDLCIRYPRDRIVFREDGYWVLSENTFTAKVDDFFIQECIEEGYLTKLSNGGVIPSEKMYLESDSVKSQTIQVESKKHPGQFYQAIAKRKRFYECDGHSS